MGKPAITFVTRNQRKFAEAQLVLDRFEIVQCEAQLQEIQGEPDAIIRHKIETARSLVQGPFFVDDTFLHFEALKGLPGPYINDFSTKLGPGGLYQLLAGFENKRAEAVALIGCSIPGQREKIFEGRIRGTVVAPRGTATFAWDPVFQPDGSAQTFAEMGIEGKSRISHRAQAFRALATYLDTVLA